MSYEILNIRKNTQNNKKRMKGNIFTLQLKVLWLYGGGPTISPEFLLFQLRILVFNSY